MRIGMIGAGNMSEAMMAAWLRKGLLKPENIVLADTRAERLNDLKERYGVNVAEDNREVAKQASILVLGVKPQQLDEVLQRLRPAAIPGGLVISIAAGKRLAWLQARLPGTRLIRVMPNIACRVDAAMSVFCAGSLAGAKDRHTAETLLSAFGRVLEMPEDQIDVVTALSGSGLAFFARMVAALTTAAVTEGLAEEQASLLTTQAMRGTAALLQDAAMSASELINAVSSERGVTVAGMEVIESSRFDAIMSDVLKAAVQRSRELAGD